MYNKYLEYLLDNDPRKVISRRGIAVRKALNPLVRMALPLTTGTKLVIVRRGKLPSSPVISAASHGFKEDSVDTLLLTDRLAYILIGSLSQIFKSADGIWAWVAGMILNLALHMEPV